MARATAARILSPRCCSLTSAMSRRRIRQSTLRFVHLGPPLWRRRNTVVSARIELDAPVDFLSLVHRQGGPTTTKYIITANHVVGFERRSLVLPKRRVDEQPHRIAIVR